MSRSRTAAIFRVHMTMTETTNLAFRSTWVASRLRAVTAAAVAAALVACVPTGAFAQITWNGSTVDWRLNTNWNPSFQLANSSTYSLVFAGAPKDSPVNRTSATVFRLTDSP